MRVHIIFSEEKVQFNSRIVGSHLTSALPKRISVGDRKRGSIFFIKPFNDFRVKFFRPVAITKGMDNFRDH